MNTLTTTTYQIQEKSFTRNPKSEGTWIPMDDFPSRHKALKELFSYRKAVSLPYRLVEITTSVTVIPI